ncbi:putative leucine-rich repeat receptor-like serine/threonine-protein kinase At2g24130 [Cryptomeria japonica]|uniref:putative leucine-rich repeat receptor-like serine/threonine-protein kinase At2g24130 n=1 Tax=Cryptomeria japonica TaxID=3369 RepID=UPI0027DA55E0|nr:putative leucine-rich repeat receptor-like serine/threonine-protein kinase At2g24130 [Cryptomeria japonica]
MLTNVVEFEFFENNLSDTIPSSLTNLSKFNRLDLSINQIRGNIPWEIGTRLPNLEYLSLWRNQLSGNIPSSLGNCSRLEVLLLNTNQLGGTVPIELGKLNFLTNLYLHTNQLVSDSSKSLGFLTALTNSSRLQEIYIGNNRFTGKLPPSIGQLSSNLNKLSLSGNMVSGNIPEQIVNLTNLTFLDLANNIFSGNIPCGIKRLHLLEVLYLPRNNLEGTIPSEIGQMQHLGLLSLHHNQLSGKIADSLCHSQQLRRLFLHHNKLSGEIPVSLEGCQKLELLDLSYKKLGGTIPGEVIASLKNLAFYLNLSWNSLEGSLPREMSKIVMAQAIDISGNQLSGVIPKSLGDCTALERLNLSHNTFVGPIPNSLSKLKNLQEMDLSFNNLSGKIAEVGLFPNRTVVILFMGNPGLCLVLEFACNGSLERHLHPDRDDDEGFCKFGLSECLSIAVDVAHGLEYLHHDCPLQIVHHDCPLQIVHCDLRPSNVLLDANMTALVNDFGISRLTTKNSMDSLSTTTFALKGSIGYIAPEYGLGGNASIKGDVYSCGILILEMVTRKRPSDDMFVGDMTLQKWVSSAFPNRLAEIVDSGLIVGENMEDNNYLISLIHVGLLCSSESPRERPSIRDVCNALESLKTSLVGGAAGSNFTATISELLENTNPTRTLASDSQSSSF